MSRLDSFIRRMTAQRDILNRAVDEIADVSGVIFELGLGNGRTFDHLRENFPQRRIFVFDRRCAAHPSSVPSKEQMILGDLDRTLPEAVARHEGKVALVHNDLGDGTAENHAEIIRILEPALPAALAPGGQVISNMPLQLAGCSERPLPDGVKPGRYFIYRRG